jgi:FkbM family methyltransferase
MLTRFILVRLRPLLRNRVYTVRNGLAKGLLRRGGLGFLPFKPLSAEHAFLLGQDFAGRTVYDIGGWEGVFSMFFARAVGPAGRVVTFEPNPENRETIAENLRINGFSNVTLLPVALGRQPGEATLAVRAHESGTGSLHEGLKSRILKEPGTLEVPVSVDTLDRQVEANRLPPPDFVKIDVEGMELDVLAGMEETLRRHKPRLFIEIHDGGAHGETGNARAAVDWLGARGYALLHVESGETVTPATADRVKGEHLFGS